MLRKYFLLAVAVVTALAALAILAVVPATAQPYPNRPVKIIVPTPAGGPVDVMARLLANALPAVLGQNVIVENRAGAGNTRGRGRPGRLHTPGERRQRADHEPNGLQVRRL
jgi:tripartite-type tricarboxylate transporter receptor subunit TctC